MPRDRRRRGRLARCCSSSRYPSRWSGAYRSDLVRGLVDRTDALIGTFAAADDPDTAPESLLPLSRDRQWHRPLGRADRRHGRRCKRVGGRRTRARASTSEPAPEPRSCRSAPTAVRRRSPVNKDSAQRRLPRARQCRPCGAGAAARRSAAGARTRGGATEAQHAAVAASSAARPGGGPPADAFAGTFHVNEDYGPLQRAFEQASRGEIPSPAAVELYCTRSPTRASLSDELRQAGAHALTLFGLHMPARLFAGERPPRRRPSVTLCRPRCGRLTRCSPSRCRIVCGATAPETCAWRRSPHPSSSASSRCPAATSSTATSWPFAETPEEEGTWARDRGPQRLGLRRGRAARRRCQRHPRAQRRAGGARGRA